MMSLVRRILVGVLSACFLFLSACQEAPEEQAVKEMSHYLGVDLSTGRIISREDTHGGFRRDGRTFIIMEVEKEDAECLEAEIAAASHWNLLPMIGNIAKAAYGETFYGVEHMGGLAKTRDDEFFFPEVSQGYYFFYDRHRESVDPYDDTGLFHRSSWNFILALYDSEEDLLYYYKLDT